MICNYFIGLGKNATNNRVQCEITFSLEEWAFNEGNSSKCFATIHKYSQTFNAHSHYGKPAGSESPPVS
jgi:hypothetical protein